MPDTNIGHCTFAEFYIIISMAQKMNGILIDKLEEIKKEIGSTIFEINELLNIAYSDYPKNLQDSFTFAEAVKLFVVIQDKAEKLSRYLNEHREVYAELEKTTDKRFDNASAFEIIDFLSDYLNKKNASIN